MRLKSFKKVFPDISTSINIVLKDVFQNIEVSPFLRSTYGCWKITRRVMLFSDFSVYYNVTDTFTNSVLKVEVTNADQFQHDVSVLLLCVA